MINSEKDMWNERDRERPRDNQSDEEQMSNIFRNVFPRIHSRGMKKYEFCIVKDDSKYSRRHWEWLSVCVGGFFAGGQYLLHTLWSPLKKKLKHTANLHKLSNQYRKAFKRVRYLVTESMSGK